MIINHERFVKYGLSLALPGWKRLKIGKNRELGFHKRRSSETL